MLAEEMRQLMEELFPINRSLMGDGVRESLNVLGQHIPIEIKEIPSGTQVFDWRIPYEWNCRDAYVKNADGTRVIDFQKNNLHVVGYSEPIEGVFSLDELKPYLHTRPDVPEAIPYLTSYYERRWGFCLSQNQLDSMQPGSYEVKIDSTLEPGSMSYAELKIPGNSEKEIFLSTYICHPSMANNELSGPVTTTYLAEWLLNNKNNHYSYRILFVPETIGAIAYLSNHIEEMKNKIIAGYVVNCVGGPGIPTYVQTRSQNTLVDKVTSHVLANCGEDYRLLPYARRGSDERQFNAPGVDLPVGSLVRTLFGDYPEYHTSLDNLDFVTGDQLLASLKIYKKCIQAIENNARYRVTTICEPQLGKRGLYPTIGGQYNIAEVMKVANGLIGYCDGEHDLIDIAEIHDLPIWDFYETVDDFVSHGLLEKV